MYIEKIGKMEIHISHDLSNRENFKRGLVSKELNKEPFMYTIVETR
jgi:hypothetical protein